MSFLSFSFSNSKPLYKSRASESIQVSSVAVLSDLFTAGFPGSLDVLLFRSSNHGGISSSLSKSPVSSNFEGNGMFIGICTRFGFVTASCTCTDAPLPSVILGNLKLARFLQQRFPFENTRRFQSPLSSAIHCEEGFESLAPKHSRDRRLSPINISLQIRVAQPRAC